MHSLSIVVLAYNEEANLEKCIVTIQPILKDLKRDYEIIIVNDGSRDNTQAVAEKLAKKYKHIRIIENRPNKGYGGAWKTGTYAATKDLVTIVHADNQFDFKEIKLFLDKQQQTDADIVSGIRPEGGKDNLYRLIVRWAANSLVRGVFGYLATDVDCGFKLLKRSALEKLTMPSNGALIDTEMFAGARARSMKIEELEVTHLPRTAGKSTGGDPRVLLKALWELFGFWWHLKQELMVERGKNVFRWEAIAILLVLLIAAFVRFYRINDYMTFLGDEGRDVMIVRDMLQGKNFPLIGPGTSVGSMYLGPWYYYLIAPSLWLANYSPIGPAVMVGLIGIATVFLMWWIGRQWFGRIEGIVVAALYALSPVVIIYSRSSWNPNVMPFFALLCVYGIWKVWKWGYWRWLIIAALSFGMALNSHYLGLLLAPLFGFVILNKHKPVGWLKYVWISIAALAVMMLPLVIFDLNPSHPLQNFNSVKKFFTERQTTVNLKVYKAIPNLWPVANQIFASLTTGTNKIWASIVMAIVGIGVGVRLYKRSFSEEFILTLSWLIVALIGLGLYKQHIYDHYFGFIFPAVFLTIGFVINAFKKWSIPLIIIIGTWALIASPLKTGPNYQLDRTQEIAKFIDKSAEGQPYNLALLAKRNYDRSYVYFLRLNNSPYYTIHEKLADQLFIICEDPECDPINNPLWEIAAFGWAKTVSVQEFEWGHKVLRLVPNPSGKL